VATPAMTSEVATYGLRDDTDDADMSRDDDTQSTTVRYYIRSRLELVKCHCHTTDCTRRGTSKELRQDVFNDKRSKNALTIHTNALFMEKIKQASN